MNDVIQFWFDKGVSGFRIDTISFISKDQSFPDAEVVYPDRRYQPAEKHIANKSQLMEYLQGMKRAVLSQHDILSVGGIPYYNKEEKMLEIARMQEGVLDMVFTFEMMDLDILPGEGRFSHKPWTVDDLRNVIYKSHQTNTEKG